jgi:hypothetical protein
MSKYPPSQRVSASRLAIGDSILIRERQADQPPGGWNDPFPTGVWLVDDISSELTTGHRRAQRSYKVWVTHPSGTQRVITAAPVYRFNKVVDS